MTLLTGATYPVRNVVQDVNDLKAQIAANAKGVAELTDGVVLRARCGAGLYGPRPGQCRRERRAVLTQAARLRLQLSDGSGLRHQGPHHHRPWRREALVDFTGTSPQRDDNFNAPAPVTRAAVLYVFRVMVDDTIPMNAGLRPISIIVPEGSMLSPRCPAAVVAGNVEVSQAVTNSLFGALEAMSSSQGTMNNLTFGNDHYQYYETICSGSPAGEGFDGLGRPHPYDEFAPYRSGDPGDAVPGGAGGFPHPAGSGGKGESSTATTLQPHDPVQEGHGLRHPRLASQGPPLRHERRRAGAARADAGPAALGRARGARAPATRPFLEAGEAVTVITPTAGGYGKLRG